MASEDKIPRPTRGEDSQVLLLEKLRPWTGPLTPSQGRPLLTRSEPPMPMLMTSVMGLPEYPFQSPLRTCWWKVDVISQTPEGKLLLKISFLLHPYVSVPTFRPLQGPTEWQIDRWQIPATLALNYFIGSKEG